VFAVVATAGSTNLGRIDELSSVASNEQRAGVYDQIAELIQAQRTTLVFVNTRRQVQRASRALPARLREELVAAHHGSLARPVRPPPRVGKALVRLERASVQIELARGDVDDGTCNAEAGMVGTAVAQKFLRRYRDRVPDRRIAGCDLVENVADIARRRRGQNVAAPQPDVEIGVL